MNSQESITTEFSVMSKSEQESKPFQRNFNKKKKPKTKTNRTKRVGSDKYKVIDTPFVDFNKPKSMIHYIKYIEDNEEYYIYGTPTPIEYNPDPKRPNDVRIVVFDDDGKMQKTKNIWYTTEDNYKYKVDKKGDEVTDEQIKEYNKDGTWAFTLEDGTQKRDIQPHHILLWSYYTEKDWSHFCKNRNATVDHILQKHEKCHFRFLEAVSRSENTSRNNIFKTEMGNHKGAIGKPLHIIVNGEKNDVIESQEKCVLYLKDKYSISISRSTISKYLKNGEEYKIGDYTLSFIYTDDYIKDNDSFKWIICADKFDETSEFYKYCNGKMPYALSLKGYVKEKNGRITRGTQVKCQKTNKLLPHSLYNEKKVHKLIYLAFCHEYNKEPLTIEKNFILHDNQHETNTIKDGKCVRYSNHIDSLRAGTNSENMNDLSNDTIIEKRNDPNNEIRVTDFAGEDVLKDVYSPNECKKKLEAMDKYKNENIKFQTGAIKSCLDPQKINATYKGLIFKYVNIKYDKTSKKYPKLFIVKNANDVEVGRYYTLDDCVLYFKNEKGIAFNKSKIGSCLNNNRPKHQSHTFEYVNPSIKS